MLKINHRFIHYVKNDYFGHTSLFLKSPFLLVALGIKLKAWLGLGKCSPTEVHLQPIALVFKII